MLEQFPLRPLELRAANLEPDDGSAVADFPLHRRDENGVDASGSCHEENYISSCPASARGTARCSSVPCGYSSCSTLDALPPPPPLYPGTLRAGLS